jgi:large subunit ribosomal protein L6
MLFEITEQKLIINTTKISDTQTFYKLLKERSSQEKSQYISLLHNQLKKVFRSTIIGYKKYLLLRGVGYKFLKKKHYLSFQVGYSHKINIMIPSDCKIKLNRKATTIQLRNFNDDFLHGLISTIRNCKKPDVYKGKGLRYKKDTVIRKEGKKKKTF